MIARAVHLSWNVSWRCHFLIDLLEADRHINYKFVSRGFQIFAEHYGSINYGNLMLKFRCPDFSLLSKSRNGKRPGATQPHFLPTSLIFYCCNGAFAANLSCCSTLTDLIESAFAMKITIVEVSRPAARIASRILLLPRVSSSHCLTFRNLKWFSSRLTVSRPV